MKRLSISELKAQKGALVNAEVYNGGADAGCHLKMDIKLTSPPRDGTYVAPH